jgi:hypothetical protein
MKEEKTENKKELTDTEKETQPLKASNEIYNQDEDNEGYLSKTKKILKEYSPSGFKLKIN